MSAAQRHVTKFVDTSTNKYIMFFVEVTLLFVCLSTATVKRCPEVCRLSKQDS
jgi:hypothetical protein